MSRGSNNKAGNSGRDASNQGSQNFGQAFDRGKSSHGKQTGEKPSMPERKKEDRPSNRNTSLNKEE
jgi:hypothetical protein